MNVLYKEVKNCLNIEGRVKRKPFIWFNVQVILIALVLGVIDVANHTFWFDYGVGMFEGIFLLIMAFPIISITIRRLHDVGLSGWWYLVCFLPYYASVILLVFLMIKDTAKGEKYGSSS